MKYTRGRTFDQVTAQHNAPVVAPVYVTSGSGAIVVIAITLFSVVVMFATSRNSDSAWSSIWGTVIFFSLALPVGLMAANGTFADMFRTWQEQRTIILLNRPYAPQPAQSTLTAVDLPQIGYEPPAAPQLADSPHFVPAVPRISETTKLDAASFISQLFDPSTGLPLPSKITPRKGQIQHKSPSPEAVEYLMSLGIVQTGEGKQLYYNSDEYTGYPTHREAINAIRTGLRRGSYEQGRRVEEGSIVSRGAHHA